MRMLSTETFLLHPLFTRILPGNVLSIAATNLPHQDEYFIKRPYSTIHTNPLMRISNVEENLHGWLTRRGFNLVCAKTGIVDIDEKRVWTVDLVTETPQEELVFLVKFYTEKRAGKRDKNAMLRYAKDVFIRTQKNYLVSPRVICLNIYGVGKISSFALEQPD